MTDKVNHPAHYKMFAGSDIEAIDIIAETLTQEEFEGYLKGAALKYRLRAGKKGDPLTDIQKALRYEEILRDNYPAENDQDGELEAKRLADLHYQYGFSSYTAGRYEAED